LQTQPDKRSGEVMRKQTRSLAASSAAVAAFLLLAPAARAVDIQSGDWKLAVTGYANAYEQLAFCNHGSVTVQGGFACQTPSARPPCAAAATRAWAVSASATSSPASTTRFSTPLRTSTA